MARSLLFVAFLLLGCGGRSTGVVATGGDTYMVAQSGGAETGAEVSAQLYREANAFCASQGKPLSKVNLTASDFKPFVRPANAKLEFRCVSGVPR